MPMDRASADPELHSAAIAPGPRSERPAATIGAGREPAARAVVGTGRARAVADTRRAQAVAGTRAVERTLRRAAARTPQALRRSPVASRRLQAELPGAAPRSLRVGLPLEKPSLQTDSCLRVSRSARDRREVRGQNHRDRQGVGCSTQALAVVRSRLGTDPLAAARRQGMRVLRKWAERELLAAAAPKRERAALAEAEREQRPEREGELPRRLTGCRRTDKICWWAGSRRRTACTRSCEKLPSSSYAALTCAAKRGEHTRFTASLRS